MEPVTFSQVLRIITLGGAFRAIIAHSGLHGRSDLIGEGYKVEC